MATTSLTGINAAVSVFKPDPKIAATRLKNASFFTRINLLATPEQTEQALNSSPNLKNTFLLGHRNDILVFDRTHEQHVPHVKAVLQMLRDTGLKADINKCAFDKPNWTAAGFNIQTVGPGKIGFVISLREDS